MDKKKCAHCREQKLSSEFTRDKSKPMGLDRLCRHCKSMYRQTDRNKRWERSREERRFREKQATWIWIQSVKADIGCQLCGEKEPVCLHYHHLVAGEKVKGLSQMTWRTNAWSYEEIKTEMRKCAVLCSNCHAKVHHGKVDGSGLKYLELE